MSHPRAFAALALASASLSLAACSVMAVDGEVIDAMGDGVPGAMVTAVGTPCTALTDDAGKFALECQPGTYKLVISAQGYTTEELDIEATERKRYNSGKHLLVKIPESRGLFLLKDGAYTEMAPGFVERTLTKDGKLTHRKMCLNPDRGEANELPAGLHALFDYEHPGWKPFKLDAEGCAYRDTKNEKLRWTVEYREKAEYETKEYNPGKEIALLKLEPGDYFIADWDKGFFNSVDSKEDKHSYTGFWLKVR